MSEVWRPVNGYEGWYEVSDQGRVRRVGRAFGATAGKILQPRLSRNGEPLVSLSVKSKVKTRRIHHLVAEAFIGPRPMGKETNHKDGNRANNTPSNLEYVTHDENLFHAMKTGLIPHGETHCHAVLNAETVREIRALREQGLKHRAIAEALQIRVHNVAHVLAGDVWRHVT